MSKNYKRTQRPAEPIAPIVPVRKWYEQTGQLHVLIIIAFSFLLYGNTLSFDYTLDDAIVITQNQFTKKGVSGIKDILTKDTFHGFFGENKKLVSGGRYRPLSLVTFALEIEMFGQKPEVSHFINILLYALTGIVLLKFLTLVFNEQKERLFSAAFLITLLYLGHPIHTEAVANIKGRDEIMCFLGGIGTLYFVMMHVKNGKPVFLFSGIITFFLTLLSKENGLTFIVIIPFTIYFFSNSSIKKILLETVPYALVCVVFWLLRSAFTNASVNMEVTEVLNNPFVYMTGSQKLATIVFTWGKYLVLLLFPHPLVHDYYFNQIPAKSWSDLRVILSVLTYLALIVLAFIGLRKKAVYSYGIIFFGLTFSVVSNLLFPIGTTMSERFVFISSFGFSLILGYYLFKWLEKRNMLTPGKLLIPFCVILVLYSVKTISRNFVWKDNLTLFTSDVKLSPNSAKLQNSCGGELMEHSDKEKDPIKRDQMLEEAVTHLNKALSIYPDYTIAWLLLGNTYFKYHNQIEKAIDCYQNIIRINPNYADAYFNLAIAYDRQGKKELAIKNYLKLLTYKPNEVNVNYTLAGLLRAKNSPDSALGFYNRVIQLDPTHPGLYREIGTTYGQLKGDFDNAIAFLKKAVEADPKDESAFENLGIAYGFKKEYDKALEALLKAKELAPNKPGVFMNLAATYAAKGDMQNANLAKNRAMELMGQK